MFKLIYLIIALVLFIVFIIEGVRELKGVINAEEEIKAFFEDVMPYFDFLACMCCLMIAICWPILVIIVIVSLFYEHKLEESV